MARSLSPLGKALEARRIAAGIGKQEVAKRMNTKSRNTYDRITRAENPRAGSVIRAAAAVLLDQDEALRLAGYEPELVRQARQENKTRQQPEQQQQAGLLAG